MGNLYKMSICAPAAGYDLVAGFLASEISFGWQEDTGPGGRQLFYIHYEKRDFLETVGTRLKEFYPGAEWEISVAETADWLESWKKFFRPVICGERFLILPPWLRHVNLPQNAARTIYIEPKSAFGTGQHASTCLCLRALDLLLARGSITPGLSFLDLGTGSGILALACALYGLKGLALDIDPVALENARENIAINNGAGITVQPGSIEKIGNLKFDVVMANILANPLCEMASAIRAACKAGGCLILSGILTSQAARVSSAYMQTGLPAPVFLEQGEWSALVWTACP